MGAIHYIAKAKDSLLLELPEEAGVLGIRAGDVVSVILEQAREVTGNMPRNEQGLAALAEIASRQEGRRHTDGSQTEQIIREGRAGAMYGIDTTG
jgi:hypothetical protein